MEFQQNSFIVYTPILHADFFYFFITTSFNVYLRKLMYNLTGICYICFPFDVIVSFTANKGGTYDMQTKLLQTCIKQTYAIETFSAHLPDRLSTVLSLQLYSVCLHEVN